MMCWYKADSSGGAGVNVKYIGYKIQGWREASGDVLQSSHEKMTLRRSVAPNSVQTMEERLVYPLQDEEAQDQVREDSDIVNDKELLYASSFSWLDCKTSPLASIQPCILRV